MFSIQFDDSVRRKWCRSLSRFLEENAGLKLKNTIANRAIAHMLGLNEHSLSAKLSESNEGKRVEQVGKLVPLHNFICDTCGQIISSPQEGYFEWLGANGKNGAREFRIVHHAPSSPLKPGKDCYKHTLHRDRSDLSLEDFIGDIGMINMLSFLDVGPYHDHSGKFVGRVENFREYTEVFRRLTIPHYEEARLYWDAAEKDGFFSEANEIWMYMPSTLKKVIKNYG